MLAIAEALFMTSLYITGAFAFPAVAFCMLNVLMDGWLLAELKARINKG